MQDDIADIKAKRKEYLFSPEAVDFAAKALGGYIAFIAALIVALLSGDGHIKTEGAAICFCILSLPPLIALFCLDRIVRALQKREKSAVRGLMALMGLGLSTIGIASILWHFSVFAAILYPIGIAVSTLYVHEVAGLGWYKKFKDI